MSDETIDDATQGAPQGDTAPQPETNDAPAPGTEQTPNPDQPKPDDKPKIDPRDRALRQAAFEARELKRQLAAVQDQIAKANPRDPNAPPSQADFDRMVEERAAKLIEHRETQTRTQAWLEAGHADFPDFDVRCNQLADMGAAENAAFMAAITKLPAGHKVLAELAEQPSEALRVLKLDPVSMAIELAGLAARAAAPAPKPAPKPTTKAPDPITPIAGQARAEPDPSKMSPEEFQKWWWKQKKG